MTWTDQALCAQVGGDAWYSHTPVVQMIDDAGVRGALETGADAYIRVAGERYRLIREHAWNTEVMQMIREQQQRARRRSTPGGAVRA